jgi:hypothetical protein
MRFMMLIKSDADAESGVMPSEALVAAMGRYNEELVKAGVLLAAEGLHASSKGARIRFTSGKRTVIDGPFAESKELIAGFWMIQVKSRDEAIEWASRVPFEAADLAARDGVGEIELRQIFEEADFPPELVAKVAEVFEAERAFRKSAGS